MKAQATSVSATGHVILGMLRAGRRTGYDIKAAVDRSTRFFWAASYGQIYPELKRLETQGLIRAAGAATGGRKRVEYELTPAGLDALVTWLTSDTPLTFELRDEGLLKFFFLDAVDRDERVRHIRRMREHHEAVVRRLREIEPAAARVAEEGRRHTWLTLMGGIELHEWIAGWCRRMEEEAS